MIYKTKKCWQCVVIVICLAPFFITSNSVLAQTTDFAWANRAGAAQSDEGYDVTIDDAGNFIATGYFQGNATFGNITLSSAGAADMYIAKYDRAGNVLWAKSAGGASSDDGYAIKTDESDNIFVTGTFVGTANFGGITLTGDGSTDIYLAKYDASGNALWAKAGNSPTLVDAGLGLTIDGSGNCTITGFFQGSVTFGTITLYSAGWGDVFVVKYDPSGNLLWAKRAGGPSTDIAIDITTDGTGNILVAGYFYSWAKFGTITLNSAGIADIFVAKYDANGNVIWAKRAGGAGDDRAYGIAKDGTGNSYVSGWFHGTVNFDAFTMSSNGPEDTFLAQYDQSGNVQWVTQADGWSQRFGPHIVTDRLGNSTLVGGFFGTANFGSFTLTSAGDKDIFVASAWKTLLADFTLYADDEIKLDEIADSEGHVGSNGEIEIESGQSGTLTGDLRAIDKIDVEGALTVDGDVITNDEIDYDGGTLVVTGTITEHASRQPLALPNFSFSAGGQDITVPKDGSLSLPPGSYSKVKAKKRATLQLSQGDYFMRKLETDDFATISIDPMGGTVTVNVVKKLDIDDDVEITLVSGTTKDVTFNVLDDNTIEIDKRANFRGTLVAPESKVKFDDDSGLKGAIYARKISIDDDVTFLHHNSGMTLPKRIAPQQTEPTVAQAPTDFDLERNYPNPFNPETRIRFQMPEAGHVVLRIFNTLGQEIRTLAQDEYQAGYHNIVWDGRDNIGQAVGSGLYLYRLEVLGDSGERFVATRKMSLVR